MLIASTFLIQPITLSGEVILNRFSFLEDMLHLVFPEQCISCTSELAHSEQNLCSVCLSELTETNFHLSTEASPMDQLFWGRFEVTKTYAHLFFEKEKSSQHVLFSLKYHDNPAIGAYFGEIIAKRLTNIDAFKDVDAYIPAPLHPKKAFIRGYNQSQAIAKGIAEHLGVALDTKNVIRAKHGSTQTRKSRFQRWDNVQSTFVAKRGILGYKHIVLVDDVITTGSTLESIAQSIRAVHPEVKISIVVLAIS
jgi:ComF family protein